MRHPALILNLLSNWQNLGEAVNRELTKTGVNVSILVPGPTDTPAVAPRDDVDFSKMPMTPMKVQAVVKGSLKAALTNKAVYVPGIMNQMMAFMTRRAISRGHSHSHVVHVDEAHDASTPQGLTNQRSEHSTSSHHRV